MNARRKVSQEHAGQIIRAILSGEVPKTIDSSIPFYNEIKALVEAMENGSKEAVRLVFDALARNNPEIGKLVAGDSAPVKSSWTVQELLNEDFPEPKWAAPGIVPVGLSVCAGRPKVGKSWLALQLAHAVGTGGQFLDREVELGHVLYLALEDPPRRLKTRLSRQQIPENAAITFPMQWKDVSDGGIDELDTHLSTNTKISLVIIDTFSRFAGRTEQNDAADMTEMFASLQQVAMKYDLSILLIDHHRKSFNPASNPIDDIFGSTAKAAVVDAVLGIYKEQGKQGAILKVTGRDIEESEIALQWDAQRCIWHYKGEAGGVQKGTIKAEIIEAVKELTNTGVSATTSHIASLLDKDRGNISRTIADLFNEGKITKGAKQGTEQPYELPQS